MPYLAGTLIRFRTYKIPILADIEKAFLQLSLDESDRDLTRFLWLKDKSKIVTYDNVTEYRFKRVNFGEISSPFLLEATIRYHLKQHDCDIAREIQRNIYVDNVLLHAEDLNEAKQKYFQSKNIFGLASMNLREFCSNNSEFNKFVEKIEGTPPLESTKFLGVKWQILEDFLEIPLPKPETNQKLTKRQILKIMASIFDPLGLISPCVFKAKLFFQYLWKCGVEIYDWDTELSQKDIKKWLKITKYWLNTKFTIPRLLFLPKNDSIFELHIFTDASCDSFAAAAYLTQRFPEKSETKLIFSKNRLAPIKGITIPRLELLGILIGTRLIKFLKKEIDIDITKCVLWSDSLCVLHWISSNKDLPKFVANRLKEIRPISKQKFLNNF